MSKNYITHDDFEEGKTYVAKQLYKDKDAFYASVNCTLGNIISERKILRFPYTFTLIEKGIERFFNYPNKTIKYWLIKVDDELLVVEAHFITVFAEIELVGEY